MSRPAAYDNTLPNSLCYVHRTSLHRQLPHSPPKDACPPPSPPLSLRRSRHPFFNFPVDVVIRNSRTACVNLSSPRSLLTEQFPGRTSPFSRTGFLGVAPSYMKPFFPLRTPSLQLVPPVSLLIALLSSPTLCHSLFISSFHVIHSLNTCSLVCAAFPHHQHMSELVHPNFRLKNGAIIACPDESWKNLSATSFLTVLRAAGTPGLCSRGGT